MGQLCLRAERNWEQRRTSKKDQVPQTSLASICEGEKEHTGALVSGRVIVDFEV